MVDRNFTWLDESKEHSEQDRERAQTLARRWSVIRSQQEGRMFDRQSRDEEGIPDGPYPCEECEACGLGDYHQCEVIQAFHQRERAQREDEDLEIELIEDKLARLGARMMRPYEHWNEDERHMQWMEEGRFGDYSV